MGSPLGGELAQASAQGLVLWRDLRAVFLPPRSKWLLEDQQRRAESLRTRGAQIAGFGALFLALIKPQPFAAISADEINNYLSDRFLSEPDLAIGIFIVELI